MATAAATRGALAGGALIAGAAAAAPRLRRRWSGWGATDDERSRDLPGDDLVPAPKLASTRAVTIDAPPEQVWPWLVQIGQGRGGLYSYDALENLAGCDIHSADRILPEHQHLEPGDLVRAGGRDTYPCWVVMDVDPPHALVLQGAGTPGDVQVPDPVDEVPDHGYVASTWQWVLEPLDGGQRTRLLVRQRCTYSPGQAAMWHVVDAVGFVMERRMLLGIKARAESSSHGRPDVGRISASLSVPPLPDRFDPAAAADLPDAARRYLTAAIAPGTPLALSARIGMRGDLRLGSRWVGFTGEEVLAPHRGFCWTARTRLGIAGSDHCAEGRGALDWRLLGIVPVVHADGPDVARSAAARAAGEAVWLPTALAAQAAATWQDRDGDGRVAVEVETDGRPTVLELEIDDEGLVRSVAFDRWGDPDGTGTFALHRFGMDVTGHATFGDLTVPAAGVAGWHHGTDRWPDGAFFRFELTDVAPIRAISAPEPIAGSPESPASA